LQFGLRPWFGSAMVAWVRRASRSGRWFGLANLCYMGSNQAVTILVAAAAGPAALGGLRAVQTLLGPAQLVAMSGESVALPTGSREYANGGQRRLTVFAFGYGTVLAGLLGMFGTALYLGRSAILRLLLGPKFVPFT